MFKETLQTALNRTDGCLSVIIMGMDGIMVEKICQPEVVEANLEIAVAEYVSLIRNTSRVNREIGLGEIQEFAFSGESGIFIMRLVGKEYFIAMILAPEGNFGRGRYELRRAEFLLEKELVI